MKIKETSKYKINTFPKELWKEIFKRIKCRKIKTNISILSNYFYFLSYSYFTESIKLDSDIENNFLILFSNSYYTNIKCLSLYRCWLITDEGLYYLSRFTNLTTIDFYGCDKITDIGLEYLFNLTKLTEIDLSCYGGVTKNIQSHGILNLSRFSNLTYLNILGCCEYITDESMVCFLLLTNLENLSFEDNGEVTEKGISYLSFFF